MSGKDFKFDRELEEIRRKKKQALLEHNSAPEQGMQWPQAVIELTDRNFNEVVNRYPLLVVDCWAPWCGPCKMVGPVIDELAKEYHGRAAFGKLNVDIHQAVARKYGIMSIPTILIFKGGRLADQQVGAVPKRIFGSIIDRHL